MRFIVYRDKKGGWRWRLVAGNGNVVADGAEGYATAGNARRAAKRMRRDMSAVPVEDK